MSYRIEDSTDLAGEIRRIVEEQIDRGVAEIGDPAAATGHTVHQLRKRCKKIRAVLRLVSGAIDRRTYKKENKRFRDIAAGLSSMRDADTLIATHDVICAAIVNPSVAIECAAVRGRLLARRWDLAGTGSGTRGRLDNARSALLAGRERVEQWAAGVRDFRDLGPGLENTYRRGRRAMRQAYGTGASDAFHEWRKQVKYHWYACRLLYNIWPPVMKVRAGELRRMSELLGAEHDLSVYRETLDSEPDWFGNTLRQPGILAAAGLQRDALRREAREPGMRLYAEKPRRLTKRFYEYWRCWQTERPRPQPVN